MEGEKIIRVNIEEEMKTAYIDYSMSVIVSRALPDVRDGLKPVHRRVLFGMYELGVASNRPYKKSARIVGEVLGKFHPHGDSSVYEAMVRMAQPWSLRYPLVDGQGNFGSVDGDSPAAMRYTEARLQKISEETLRDIDKNTVDFQLNFDDTIEEPTVLPTRIPTLIVNGTSGIAVGMATNMAPHNLRDTINAIIAYVDDKEVDIQNLIILIKAPDFPTGGIIYGMQGFKEAYETGRGRIVIRSKTEIETEPNGRERIIVTEIPYLVNKSELIRKTAELVNEKKIDGITNISDESDRTGMRIVYDIRRDTLASVVLNKLFKYTQLQTSFNVNSIALVKGRPKTLNLKQLIENFVNHRHDVVVRRTRFELDQAQKKAHILEGLLIALDHLDEVINLIRASKNPEEAKDGLMQKFSLSEIQAKAILDMRLQKLTGLERDKIKEEYAEIQKLIEFLTNLLESEVLRLQVIKDELIEIRDNFGDERRTEVVPDEGEFNPEDFYVDEDMVVTISHLGYIKRTPVTEFKTQNRGGVGAKGSNTRDEDFLEHMFIASMHNTMLFFTEKGKCFWLKVYEIPEGAKNSKGRAIQNIINIEQEDKVKAYINVQNLTDKEYIENKFILMATKKGIVKKTKLVEYSRPRQNGVNAITIKDGDQLLQAKLTDGKSDIVLATREGKAVRFNESKVRSIGRTGAGVRGITLSKKDDEVVGMVWVEAVDNEILVVSENGYGKRSSIEDYRITNRGGKGVKTINITEKTGKLITIKGVDDTVDLMIINKSGLTIRLAVADLRITGRATQGVRLINLKNNDSIAAVAQVEKEDTDSTIDENNGPNFDIITEEA
ncbi:MAG: DNA gyrase subunit A [Bacteroidetes bacterium GWF2_33_16]|nr:MAG: DNA gyrase subunit A [Bacteroidetes bacterium GWE2_32_14]OFY07169.1 MAG: DNA gyrase subunit A [Bacteroidetes bacterium GWF2_33_16]